MDINKELLETCRLALAEFQQIDIKYNEVHPSLLIMVRLNQAIKKLEGNNG